MSNGCNEIAPYIALQTSSGSTLARMKATKIVATLGPASDTVDIITAMIEAGADEFRLIFSHGTP